MQMTRPIVLTLASAFLLAGCGSSTSSSAPQSAASPASSAAASSAATASAPAAAGSTQLSCDLVPATLVNGALGTDLGAPSQSDGGNAIACQYKGAKAGAVEIRIATGETAAAFATERTTFASSGQATTAYAGFGDQAYTSTQKMPLGLPDVNTLVALKGSVDILISSSASIPAERALEEQLFAKIS